MGEFRRFIDHTGQRFGRLLVVCRASNHTQPNGNRIARFMCRCDCGNEVIVRAIHLRSGASKSCGCLWNEFSESLRTHGDSCGDKQTPEYRCWADMKDRCNNPNTKAYRHYGGRGITVCDRWMQSYGDFLADVGRRPSSAYSIDRINNDGNYEPGNVRWATREEQTKNKRRSNQYLIRREVRVG